MKRIAVAGALAWLALPATVSAQTRSEAPIREVVLSDGAWLYAVPIKVGSIAIDAGLDSGSTGLRVLPKTLDENDAKAGTMDTGAPGIFIVNSSLGKIPWPDGTAATLAFLRGEHLAAIERFTVGLRSHASHLALDHNDRSPSVIRAGLSPYFAFDVLYLPDQNMIGLKPRAPAPNAPSGVILNSAPDVHTK